MSMSPAVSPASWLHSPVGSSALGPGSLLWLSQLLSTERNQGPPALSPFTASAQTWEQVC